MQLHTLRRIQITCFALGRIFFCEQGDARPRRPQRHAALSGY